MLTMSSLVLVKHTPAELTREDPGLHSTAPQLTRRKVLAFTSKTWIKIEDNLAPTLPTMQPGSVRDSSVSCYSWLM